MQSRRALRSAIVGASFALIAVMFQGPFVAFGSSTARPLPFFFSGDGTLTLTSAHFDETIHVRYRTPEGTYDSGALEQINHVFRSPDNKEDKVSLRLVELLAFIQRVY